MLIQSGERDGFETIRVHLDPDRVVNNDGSYNSDAIEATVIDRVKQLQY